MSVYIQVASDALVHDASRTRRQLVADADAPLNLPIMAAESTKNKRDQKAAKALRPVVMSAMFMVADASCCVDLIIVCRS